jgi:hypothetical protein
LGWLVAGLLGTLVVLLVYDDLIRRVVPVTIGGAAGVVDSHWNEGHIVANGTWVTADGRQADPLQVSEIFCEKANGQCRSSTAKIQGGDRLAVVGDTYGIMTWTDEKIAFTSIGGQCVDEAYTLTRADLRLVATRSPKKEADAATCAAAVASGVQQLSLLDGRDVASKLEADAKAHYQPHLWIGLVVLWIAIAWFGFLRPRR